MFMLVCPTIMEGLTYLYLQQLMALHFGLLIVFSELKTVIMKVCYFNLLNSKLNPICHLLTLLGAHHILHVSRIRVKQHFMYFLLPVVYTCSDLGVNLLQILTYRYKCNCTTLYPF